MLSRNLADNCLTSQWQTSVRASVEAIFGRRLVPKHKRVLEHKVAFDPTSAARILVFVPKRSHVQPAFLLSCEGTIAVHSKERLGLRPQLGRLGEAPHRGRAAVLLPSRSSTPSSLGFVHVDKQGTRHSATN
jgi:hypothetical protein